MGVQYQLFPRLKHQLDFQFILSPNLINIRHGNSDLNILHLMQNIHEALILPSYSKLNINIHGDINRIIITSYTIVSIIVLAIIIIVFSVADHEYIGGISLSMYCY